MPILGSTAGGTKGAPSAPLDVVATDVGTGRAYNDGAAIVSFTPPSGSKLPITGYTVTSSPGSFTATGASSPITVAGLQSDVAYTFTVTANTSVVSSLPSAASNSITATTVPQAPTLGSLNNPSNTRVTIPITGGSSGGKSITSYSVTTSISVSTSGTSTINVDANYVFGTSYTFNVSATNDNGTSTATVSSSISPVFWAVGRRGPGGGTIFYDAGSNLSWGRYMEVAPGSWRAGGDDLGIAWGNSGIISTSDAIGTAFTNTTNIVNALGGGTTASTARAYTGNGFTNWSLPSIEDLQLIYNNLGAFSIGGTNYWSSTTNLCADNRALVFSMANSSRNCAQRSSNFGTGTRPVRYFT